MNGPSKHRYGDVGGEEAVEMGIFGRLASAPGWCNHADIGGGCAATAPMGRGMGTNDGGREILPASPVDVLDVPIHTALVVCHMGAASQGEERCAPGRPGPGLVDQVTASPLPSVAHGLHWVQGRKRRADRAGR